MIIGSGGIGIEIAKTLLSKGIKVCLTYHKSLDQTNKNLTKNGISGVELYHLDVNDKKSITNTITSLLTKYESIDSVVYCVSAPITYTKIEELAWEDFQDHINVQIKGLFDVVKSLFPIIKSKHKIKFVVLITESCIGRPPTMISHYITAKYGLMGFVKSMASELVRYNCTFNMVSPGRGCVDINWLAS